ncbi:MAG: FliM/FliN family flagellar motor C-terminal domain-containing protein, partial [Armatimonadota bacterium]|nr:FliM/FliN family flagellar motor C-terminal domain-containing protein [Armatimonadota bacterium]
ASLTVQDVADMQVGQVLPMQVTTDAASGQPGRIGSVDLVIGSEVKFRGKTGLRGKNLAVQIEEVVSPPAELVSHREVS